MQINNIIIETTEKIAPEIKNQPRKLAHPKAADVPITNPFSVLNSVALKTNIYKK